MATVNFSVPLDVKQSFNTVFSGQNKSAVIARLMTEAVEEEYRRQRRAKAIDALLVLREHAPGATDEEVRAARVKGRP